MGHRIRNHAAKDLTVFFLFLLLAGHALAQNAYSVSVAPPNIYQTILMTGSDCLGPFSQYYTRLQSEQTLPDVSLTQLQFVRKEGSWIPASNTESLTFNSQGSTFVGSQSVSLSQDGTLTTKDYTPVNDSNKVIVGSASTISALNLSTGQYNSAATWNYVLPDDGNSPDGGTCPASFTNYYTNSATVSVILTPGTASSTSLTIVDPSLTTASLLPLQSNIDVASVAAAPGVNAVSADGASAAAIVFQSNSSDPVTFTLGSSTTYSGSIGSLTAYDPSYLNDPPGAPLSGSVSPIASCDGGTCTFVVLLWAPTMMPTLPNGMQAIPLTVTAEQDSTPFTTSVELQPPPVVLVHGIWANANSWNNFKPWLLNHYPHEFVSTADYGPYSSLSFRSPLTQEVLTSSIADVLTNASSQGVVARKVDIVAHSMGGLVTRYLVENGPTPLGYLPGSPIHKLVTIATPHTGTPIAESLITNENNPPSINSFGQVNPVVTAYCSAFAHAPCTLANLFANIGKPVTDGAVASLQHGLASSNDKYSSVVGEAPATSASGSILNTLISSFLPGASLGSIFNSAANDLLVPVGSQTSGAADYVTVNGVIHTSIVSPLGTYAVSQDAPAELQDSTAWSEVLSSLSGVTLAGVQPAVVNRPVNLARPMDSGSGTPSPTFDLTGYTQVPISNVVISPNSNSTLTIGTSTTITTTSSTKTLSEVFVLQNVTDPSDFGALYSTQSPFSMSFTPTRLGSVDLVFFAVFTDNTYASTTLHYALQVSGSPLDVRITTAPIAALPANQSVIVNSVADFSSGSVSITNAATYGARSGGTGVFSLGLNGALTATGNGTDFLDVTYGGKTASALITVGSCSYSLSPTTQLIGYGGGSVSIQVLTQNGCSWTAVSDSVWLGITKGVGVGASAISATASANTTGSTRTAYLSIGNKTVAVIQPATACTYTVNPASVSLTATGGTGTLSVSTSCPIISSSSASWLNSVTLSGSSVQYTADANVASQSRSAILSVGSQQVTVAEAGATTPAIGINPTSLSFGNQLVGHASLSMMTTVSNPGTASLAITKVSINGSNADAFVQTNTCGTGIGAGGNCSISVVFTPVGSGVASATLSITDNASGSPHALSLSGIGMTPPPATITWATPAAINYGTALGAGQLNATASVPGQFSYSPIAGTILAAGTDTLTVIFTPTDTIDYAPSTASVQIVVNRAVPPVSWATPAAITYGTVLGNAQLNASSPISGSFAYNPAAGAVLNVGPQTLSVTFTPTDSTDYTSLTTTVTLLVNKVAPVVTWSAPAAITYGTSLSMAQLNATASVPGTFVYNPSGGTVLGAGMTTLSVSFTPSDSSHYASASASVPFTVNRAAPSILWSAPSAITYGVSLSGTQLNASSTIPGAFTYAPPTGTVLGAGIQTLSVTFMPTDAADYTSATATVPITVTKNTPVINWPQETGITYGTPLSSLQLDATVSAPGGLTYSPAAGAVLSVGAHTLSVTFVPTDSTDMNATSSNVSLIVGPAVLKVTATNATRAYGASNPVFNATLAGVVNGDTITATATTTATSSSSPGTYPITAIASGAAIGNYSVTSVPGALTITTASTSSTVAISASTIVVGSSISFTATVTSSIAGASPTGSVQFMAGGVVLGSAQLTSGAASYSTSGLTVGTFNIVAVYSGDVDFAGSSSLPTILTIAPLPDFAVAANPTALTLKQGESGSATITVTTVGGFNSPVSFSCSGLPTGATCSFSSSNLPTGLSAVSTQLTVKTTPSFTALRMPSELPGGSRGSLQVSLAGLLAIIFSVRRRKGFSKLPLLAGVCLCLFSLAGCGTGAPSPTPVGTYSVGVVVSSGSQSTSHTVQISLTVN